MGEVVDLHGQPAGLEDDLEFVSDLARFAEGLFSEQDVKKKHHLSADTWERLGNNETLIEKIEAEKVRRIRNGASAREKAQQLFVTAPGVLGNILHDDGASPRHRIESAKELRVIAATGPEAAPAADRFQITINLGSDVLHFDKSIAIDANDVDPFNDTDTTPQGLLAAIAANKRKDDGGGEPV
jgi:hypothetical protein